MSYELLSEPIRRYIRNKKWEFLRPIQHAAILKILTTDYHYILASRTASGKTEAAFLPILSALNFEEPGVQIVYISPLIALINDQFFRIEEMCKDLEIPITRWHGEASVSAKKKLQKTPSGIILITPESLEALFVNKPWILNQLFSNLKFVVIDEIHSFLGTDRGIQLQSLLSRLKLRSNLNFRIIGLSATIGDYSQAKRFTGEENRTKVLLDREAKEIHSSIHYIPSIQDELPEKLIEKMYSHTRNNRVLIFPNSRGKAEEIAFRLSKLSERLGGHAHYFSHHASIHRMERERIEQFARESKDQAFCISCTSTLELGIDIGNMEKVIQVDSTYSISSLIQRVGRSGRTEGSISELRVFTTNFWSLLQSISCWLLFQEGYIEPVPESKKPYDLLLHQILSISKEKCGINQAELLSLLNSIPVFNGIISEEKLEILSELMDRQFLEKIGNEIILGIEGEKLVNTRDFYSVFKTEKNLTVLHSGKSIGTVPQTPQIIEGENIMLSARTWKIIGLDLKANKVEVVPAQDGRKPLFIGSGGIIHAKIREKMMEVLYSDTEYEFLDQEGKEKLSQVREQFKRKSILLAPSQRPYILEDRGIRVFTFTGTQINRALHFALTLAGIQNQHDENSSSLTLNTSSESVAALLEGLPDFLPKVDDAIRQLLYSRPGIINFTKWGKYLPENYQIEILKSKYYDFKGAEAWLRGYQSTE